MASYVSDNGKWIPAQEKVAVTNSKGEPEIYSGKDRSAVEEMKAGNVESRFFWEDTEWINRVRQVNNMSMEEYMKSVGFDKTTSNETFAKHMAEVNTHKDKPRKPATRQPSGGRNTAGNAGHLEGDFGGENEARAKVK